MTLWASDFHPTLSLKWSLTFAAASDKSLEEVGGDFLAQYPQILLRGVPTHREILAPLA